MSFITKRERVFNEYDVFDLPARNEGKLKAYASCTDARAWSHFGSDKAEHLVEIIKRNNETCRPKYVPTDAIVNTLMAGKNCEIGRLKRKIEEFEQMLAVYDQLELTCEQKCEIANAHAAIKAANKELDDMCLDLNLSGYTEGIDSEAFETGKSRGDEASLHTAHEVQKSKATEWEFEKEAAPIMETKANQTASVQPRDASTSAHDPRIDELQDVIITKDAKLSAMQNTLAVMENDICEPYCIYAHIYTALEKIFGALSQNKKYKEYLDLLTAGKDTRSIDVKGKILFKLKVLEKFSLALIAPCSQEKPSQSQHECSCYHVEVETAFALTSSPTRNVNLDSKRALLVADIIDNQEIKEILSKDSVLTKVDDDQNDDSYSIETENLNRLKNLQVNYEDLLNCYENLKYEKNCLFFKCKNYDELEKEFERLKRRLQEYNVLWNEKEHYRKRSEDLDTLKEKFLVLSEETSNIETKLKAETEINNIKCKAVDELRCENIDLQKKLNDMVISFEREKNMLTCKLKEYECKIMCQEEQIKSLSMQVDQVLEQDRIPSNIDSTKTLELNDEIDSLKHQIKNLRNALICEGEEKQQLQEEFENKLELINNLKMDIEDWKSNYDTAVRMKNYEVQMLKEENKALSKEMEEKLNENTKLMSELEHKKDLCLQLQKMAENYDTNLTLLENEKKNALFSLQLARTDSQKLIGTYETPNNHQYQFNEDNLRQDHEENERCLMNIVDHDNGNSILLQEIQKLRADNITNIGKLKDENVQNKISLELLKKESTILRHKLHHLESVSQQFQNVKESHDRLFAEKVRLENELRNKTSELNNIKQLTRRESETLITRLHQSDSINDQLTNNYQDIVRDKNTLLADLSNKDSQLQILTDSLNCLKIENERLRQEKHCACNLERELRNLNIAYENLQKDFDNKSEELQNLYHDYENKIMENRDLYNRIKSLISNDLSNKDSLTTLQTEKICVEQERSELKEKLKRYENIEKDLDDLKSAYDKIKSENLKLLKDIEIQTTTNKNLQDKNNELNTHSQNLLLYNEELEKKLVMARNEAIKPPENEELSIIQQEIENMKREKKLNNEKIKNLIHKLDEAEQIIFKLNEDILTRDDKIAVLENHINQLQDELRRLHGTLANLMQSSEEIKEYSLQNLNQSLKRMEAHHSKATHNMRIELAKLQNANTLLEDKLSTTTMKSEESFRDIQKLHTERKTIATEIKQLEMKSIGESNLSPGDCTVEDILTAISKITKSFESRHLKNTSLERTLLKVQSSFQLVVEKADEERKLVNIEKQKLIDDKEAALLDLKNTETKLTELKNMYENQITRDKCIINDLGAEILKQNRIIDELKKSKDDYISKLQQEIDSLQKIYETSAVKISELQDTMHNISLDNNRNQQIIAETNLSLNEKCKEIVVLKNTLQNLRNKSVQSVWTQAEIVTKELNDHSTQTHRDYQSTEKNISEPITLSGTPKLEKDINQFTENLKEFMPVILPQNEAYSLNEVQILRSDVKTLFLDGNKTVYLDYKMKRLNFGPMEKCSIPSLDNSQSLASEKSPTIENVVTSETSLKENFPRHSKTNKNSNVIDVYSLHSKYTSSSHKLYNKNEIIHEVTKPAASLSSSSFSNLRKVTKNGDYRNNSKMDIKKNKSDKDLFVIYKDSNSNDTSPSFKNDLLELYHKDQKQHLNTHNKSDDTNVVKTKLKKSKNVDNISNEKRATKTKPTLQIDLPRISHESSTVINISEGENKSIDSYTKAIYSSPKRNSYSDTNINDQQDISNVPLYGSPNTYDKLSYEEKVHDIFLNYDCQSGSLNNKLQEEINISLLRISNDHDTNSPADISFKEIEQPKSKSHHKLSRIGENVLLIEYSNQTSTCDPMSSQHADSQATLKSENFGLQYILNTIKCENDPQNISSNINVKCSDKNLKHRSRNKNQDNLKYKYTEPSSTVTSSREMIDQPQKSFCEFGVLVKMDSIQDYENKIRHLTKTLENIEKDYKKKIEAVKMQYDSNIKNIINEHNEGVKSIQSLHEETMQDVIKIHENEIENLRSMSIEALRRVEKLEKENHRLKTQNYDNISATFYDDEEPVKLPMCDMKKRRGRSRVSTKTLTKTKLEAFNVKPKSKSIGPCTCSVDMNISDTIRNIFEQVDVEQRKVAENAYLKYIANKISNNNIEALDAQELSFLHLKVCRTWKTKLTKEEALQKKIDSLESELINKQRQAQQHMAELDRKVAEERRRLQEVREAVYRNSPEESHAGSPEPTRPQTEDAKTNICICNPVSLTPNIGARRSAGDLGPGLSNVSRCKRTKTESNRAVLAKLDTEERRDKKYYDEPPIRLKRSHDRPTLRKK